MAWLRSQDRSHAASFQIHEVRADGTLVSRKSDGDDCGYGHGVKFRGKSTESFHFRRENNSAPRRTAGGWSRGIDALWKFRTISAGNIMCCSLWFSFSLFPVNSGNWSFSIVVYIRLELCSVMVSVYNDVCKSY